MIKIGFIGGYGYDDIGDESMLNSDLSHARRLLPNAQLIAFSDDPPRTKDLHGIESRLSTKRIYSHSFPGKVLFRMRLLRLGWRVKALIFSPWLLYNAQRLARGKGTILLSADKCEHLESIRACNVIWNVGGGNLCSIFPEELYSKTLFYRLCEIMNVPVYVTGQTIGPLNNKLDRWVLRWGLDCVEMVTTRDIERSRKLLQSCGVTKPEIYDGVDDAFDLEPIAIEEVDSIYNSLGLDRKRPIVAVNIRVWSEVNEFIRPFAGFLDSICEKYDLNFLFIPTQYLGRSDDRLYGRKLKDAMRYGERFYIAEKVYKDHELKGLIGQADFAIGIRYHFIVYAATMGVPSIGLFFDKYYEYKHDGILRMTGLASAVCPASGHGLSRAEELMEDLFLNRKKWKEYINKHYQNLLPLRQYTVKRVIEGIRHTEKHGKTENSISLTELETKIFHEAHILDKVDSNIQETGDNEMRARQEANLKQLIMEWSHLEGGESIAVQWAQNLLGLAKNSPLQSGRNKISKTLEPLMDVIHQRRSVRLWKDEPIGAEILLSIMEAALWAPSSGHRQAVRFIVATTERSKETITKLKEPFLKRAPLVLLTGVDLRAYKVEERGYLPYLDTGASIQNLLLAAHQAGLGACWIKFGPDDWKMRPKEYFHMRRTLNLPDYFFPTSVVVAGYPKRIPKAPPRKSLKDIVAFEQSSWPQVDFPPVWRPEIFWRYRRFAKRLLNKILNLYTVQTS